MKLILPEEQYREAAGTDAFEFEQQCLSIGRELLPREALTVLDGGKPDHAYYTWLVEQWEKMRRHQKVTKITGIAGLDWRIRCAIQNGTNTFRQLKTALPDVGVNRLDGRLQAMRKSKLIVYEKAQWAILPAGVVSQEIVDNRKKGFWATAPGTSERKVEERLAAKEGIEMSTLKGQAVAMGFANGAKVPTDG